MYFLGVANSVSSPHRINVEWSKFHLIDKISVDSTWFSNAFIGLYRVFLKYGVRTKFLKENQFCKRTELF